MVCGWTSAVVIAEEERLADSATMNNIHTVNPYFPYILVCFHGACAVTNPLIRLKAWPNMKSRAQIMHHVWTSAPTKVTTLAG
jgi:hypothetical protein